MIILIQKNINFSYKTRPKNLCGAQFNIVLEDSPKKPDIKIIKIGDSGRFT
jgi:hypothetical protein